MEFGDVFGRRGARSKDSSRKAHNRKSGPGGTHDPVAVDVGDLVRGYPGPAFAADARGGILAENAAAHELCAALRDGLLPDLVARINRVADLRESVQEALELGQGDGNVLFQLTLMPLNPAGAETQVLVLCRDATMERNLTAALVASRQMFKDLVECSTDFAWETNADGRFGFVSPPGALGYLAEELEGRHARTLCVDPEGFQVFETRERLERTEVVLQDRDGEAHIFQISARPVLNPGGNWGGARGVAQDVTGERRRAEALKIAHERLEQRSRTDDLTGLLNRRAFMEELAKRLRQQLRHRQPGTLMFIDLNNFKSVNDAHGHAAGDAVLQAFGRALQESCRAGDMVARLGGDEFAIWLEDSDQAGAARKAQTLRRIGEELGSRFRTDAPPLGVALGIAMRSPGDQESVEDLLARADAAMYRDKNGTASGAKVGRGGACSAGSAG